MLTSTTEVTLEWALCNAHTLTNFQSAWACEEDAPTTQRRHVHVVVALTQRTDLGGRVLKQITKHHPHFTRLRRELDFKKAVKYTSNRIRRYSLRCMLLVTSSTTFEG